MKLSEVAGLLVLLVVLGLILLLVAGALDPTSQASRDRRAELRDAEAAALAPLWLAVKRVLLGSLAGAGSIVLVGGALLVVRWLKRRSELVYPDRRALFPVTYRAGELGAPINDPLTQPFAALTNGRGHLDRLPAGFLRGGLPATPAALTPPRLPAEVAPPAPDAAPEIPLAEALTVDPVQRPHTLLIGETGAGKSSATFVLLRYIQRHWRAEVLVCEKDGVDWNDQAGAITPLDYHAALQAVEAERQRRAALLRAADVNHINRLAEPPPYLVVVIEEAEAIYGDLKLAGRTAQTSYVQFLRHAATLGRKEGILLICATQTGTSSVFDITVRKQFGTRWFFRSEPGVGDAWGIPRAIRLPDLPTGTAYALGQHALVRFPEVARPELRLSQVYYARPDLPPDRWRLAAAGAPGAGVPTIRVRRISPPELTGGADRSLALAAGSATPATPDTPATPATLPGAGLALAGTAAEGVGIDEVLVALAAVERAADLNAAQRQRIIACWEELVAAGRPSLNEVQRRLFPGQAEPGGHAYRVVAPVIHAYLRARGERPPWLTRRAQEPTDD